MKFNTRINKQLEVFYLLELHEYKTAYLNCDYNTAWHHLERAHIIAQKYPYQHTYVHYKMLLFGFKTKNVKEIIGQIPRLFVGGIKSFVGKVPLGNPGGANVPALKSFDIADDIKGIFKSVNL